MTRSRKARFCSEPSAGWPVVFCNRRTNLPSLCSSLAAALAAAMLMADTFVIQRARVLTIPFFFTFVIILLFWSARRSAERQDTEQE